MNNNSAGNRADKRAGATPKSERRIKGARFTAGALPQMLNFYPGLACVVQGGVIGAMNVNGAEFLGLDQAAAPGHPLAEFFTSEFAGFTDAMVSHMLETREPFSARMRTAEAGSASVNMRAQWAREISPDTVVLTAQDMSGSLGRLEVIKRSEDKFRHLVDNVLDLVCVVENGLISFVNRTGLQMLRAADQSKLAGRSLADLFHPDYSEFFSRSLPELSRASTLIPAKLLSLDGIQFDAHVTVRKAPHLGVDCYVVQARDISEHRRTVLTMHHANLERESRDHIRIQGADETNDVRRRSGGERPLGVSDHDDLTGLANRMAFLESLRLAITNVEGKPDAIAVLSVQLDGLDAAIDELAGPVGDKVLQIAAQRLVGCIRKSDLAARIGKDEFAVVLNNVRNPRAIEARARDIIQAMNAPFDVGARTEAHVRARVGVARYPGITANPEDILTAASAFNDGEFYDRENFALVH
ncbi:MAG: diguanylate cyclase [Rhodospirillales bacterium]|nr:diguanylate cyclase [Rhodospirillales bacterium]